MNYAGYLQDINGNNYYTRMKSIKIPKNSDLNNYRQEGMYYNDSNSEVATILNVPHSRAFSLLVEKHAGCKQTFSIYDRDTPSTYIRNYYSGVWGNWKKIQFE